MHHYHLAFTLALKRNYAAMLASQTTAIACFLAIQMKSLLILTLLEQTLVRGPSAVVASREMERLRSETTFVPTAHSFSTQAHLLALVSLQDENKQKMVSLPITLINILCVLLGVKEIGLTSSMLT